MGMLLHNTLMEQEKAAKRKQTEPVEVPTEEKPESEPVKKTGRRKTTSK